MTPRPPALARLFDVISDHGTRRDVLELVDAAAELDELLEPVLTARWVTRTLPAGGSSVYVYTISYRLAGLEWTGEAAIPPGIDPARMDDGTIRRVQAGAARALREQIIPTGSALEAAIRTGRP